MDSTKFFWNILITRNDYLLVGIYSYAIQH